MRWILWWTASLSNTTRIPELARLLPILYPGVFPHRCCLHQTSSGPGGHLAHRHPLWDHPRFPEFHG